MNVRADQIAHALRRMQQVAVDLRALNTRSQERKCDRRIIPACKREYAALDLAIEIDAIAVETRRRAGFESSPLEAARLQRFRQLARRRFTCAPGRMLFQTDVNPAVEERASRDHERTTRVRVAILQTQ